MLLLRNICSMTPLTKLSPAQLPAAIAAQASTLELFKQLAEVVDYGRVEFEWVHGELRYVRVRLDELILRADPPHS